MKTFEGLNVSSKFAICGLPIRLDSYKTCDMGCRYCFANARKIMEFKKELMVANVSSIERRLHRLQTKEPKSFLDIMIKSGITWHCGGMSDPFQKAEKELKITEQIVDITSKYNISILFSTKSDNLYGAKLNPKLHTIQMSISNVENRNDIETDVPKIENRLELFKELKTQGFKVGIRIQPFIPNVSNLEIVKMFDGADHYTIEGLKIVPQNQEQKSFVYNELRISPEMFTQKGLLTLKPQYRLTLYKPFIEYFNNKGLSYSISDNDLRIYTNSKCCCGDKLVANSTSFNTTAMIQKYGHNYNIEDINKELNLYHCSECVANGLFTSNRTNGCKTVSEFFNKRIKDKTSPFSPRFQYHQENNSNQLCLF